MKKWIVKKQNMNGDIIADYGSFNDFDDVSSLIKGYKLNEELNKLFGITCYTRTNSNYYFDVVEIEL